MRRLTGRVRTDTKRTRLVCEAVALYAVEGPFTDSVCSPPTSLLQRVGARSSTPRGEPSGSDSNSGQADSAMATSGQGRQATVRMCASNAATFRAD